MSDASTATNLALVEKMYACFNQGDMETIRNEIFAPDIIWNLPGRNPLSGTKHGAEEVLAFFTQLLRANIKVTLDPASDPSTGVDTFGKDTVVEVHRGQGQTTTRDPSGKEVTAVLNALNCTHYKIRSGRIAEVQVYISDQHAVDSFFWAVYQLKPIPDRLAQ